MHRSWKVVQKANAQQWQHSVSEGMFSKMRAPNHSFAVQFGMVWSVSLDLCLISDTF